MKLHILSDLHLNVSMMDIPETDADLIILAGDIARPKDAIAWARNFDKPVLYIPGNHEFYGLNLLDTIAELRSLTRDSNIQLLNNDSIEVCGIRFLGTTLWTDFLISGPGKAQSEAIQLSQKVNHDFKRIQVTPNGLLLTPYDCSVLFAENSAWLQKKLAQPYTGKTVVITHHAPSAKSVPERFIGSPLNVNFVSNMEQLIKSNSIKLWIHGHFHDSCDYFIDKTRVLCNPRGYTVNKTAENKNFNPWLVVEI